jgi:hypothetical protein
LLCGAQDEQEAELEPPFTPGEANVENRRSRSLPLHSAHSGLSPGITSTSIFFLQVLQ